jgi:hypothetical protein
MNLSFGGSGGAGGGISLVGAGAEATNIILNKTNAFVADSTLISAGDVNLLASGSSTIKAMVSTAAGSLAVGGGTGVGVSIGASVALNYIGWTPGGTNSPAEVQAYVLRLVRVRPVSALAGPVWLPTTRLSHT